MAFGKLLVLGPAIVGGLLDGTYQSRTTVANEN